MNDSTPLKDFEAEIGKIAGMPEAIVTMVKDAAVTIERVVKDTLGPMLPIVGQAEFDRLVRRNIVEQELRWLVKFRKALRR